MRDQALGGGPSLFVGFPHDHVQADTEAYFAPLSSRFFAHLCDLLGNGCRWLAPGQVELDLFGRQVLGGLGGAAEIQRWAWLLNRRVEQLGAFYLDVLTVVIDVFAFQHLAPDTGELDRGFVALLVVQVQAVTRQLVRITTGHQVE
ncbi:hypothetical protein D3C79_624650 [compost metagenome]